MSFRELLVQNIFAREIFANEEISWFYEINLREFA